MAATGVHSPNRKPRKACGGTCEYNIGDDSRQKIAEEETVDQGESAFGTAGVDDASGEGLNRLVQGAEAEVGDDGAGGKAEGIDEAKTEGSEEVRRAPRIRMKRSIRGMAAEKKRSAGVSGGGVEVIVVMRLKYLGAKALSSFVLTRR